MKSMLVIGLGRFGQHLASNLLDLGNDVMIIDSDERKLEGLVPYATSSKIGDCTNPEVLRSLGIGNFDVIFICIGTNFQSSLEITSLVKEMGGKHVVSKATRDIQAKFLLRNGADDVVYPERETASWAAVRYSSDHIFDYIQLTPDHAIYETAVPPAWVGKTIGQLGVRQRHNINILAAKRGEELIPIPGGDYCFREGETMLVLGADRDVQKFLHF